MFFFCAKAKRQRQDVGHEGVITGCDGFSLRSSIADPQESLSRNEDQLKTWRFNIFHPKL